MSVQPVGQLAMALDATGQVISAIRDEQWSLSTPCPPWTVSDLVDHLVSGNHLFAEALGQTPASPRDPVPTVRSPLDAFQHSAEVLLDAFSQPNALGKLVTVPFGTVPGAVALQLRVTEILVHGWDLARATAQPVAFPEDLSASALAFSRSKLSAIPSDRRPFAPPQPVADNASAIDRLAACLGRTVA